MRDFVNVSVCLVQVCPAGRIAIENDLGLLRQAVGFSPMEAGR